MIKGYVGNGEKVLFGVALAFSVLVYTLIALGVGAVVLASQSTPGYSEDSFENNEDFGTEELLQEVPNEGISKEEYFEVVPDREIVGEGPVEAFDDGMLVGNDDPAYEDFQDFEFASETTPSPLASLIAAAGIFIFYITLFVLIVVGSHIIAVGHLMGNGVRVSERQFPELWAIFGRAALELGIKKLPAFYLVESGGLLNAFATRLFTRSYVAIYADLAERLYEGDEDSIAFVVAHELVHVKRNHMFRNLITLPAEIIPFLKSAWRRACEYSCDAGAALLAPTGTEKGLVLLAAGKKLSARMDVEVYLESFRAEKSIWKRLAEITASHPHLPKRIEALRRRDDRSRQTDTLAS